MIRLHAELEQLALFFNAKVARLSGNQGNRLEQKSRGTDMCVESGLLPHRGQTESIVAIIISRFKRTTLSASLH